MTKLRINGDTYEIDFEARVSLLDALREECGLTGTHAGCEQGVCGACTVLIDGRPVRSCLMLAVQAAGTDILTVEGLAAYDEQGVEQLHPLQEAFNEHHGFQCGFCTPGMLLTAVHFLNVEPHPTREQIREQMSGNICRCTGYQPIVDAVEAVVRGASS